MMSAYGNPLGARSRGAIVYAARVGYAAKGSVYAVVGVLALLAAIGESTGRLTDSKGAIATLGSQPFGVFVLWALSFGLTCYALWNAIRAGLDPEQHGKGAKAILQRIGYAVSSFVHVALALYAGQLAYGSAHSSSNTRTWVAKLLGYSFGAPLVAIIGIIAIGFGLSQIYIAVSGKAGHQYAGSPLPTSARRVARVGVFARGMVFPVIGVSLVMAAWRHDPGEADGFGEALRELASGPLGSWLLSFVAAGLFAYGVHLFFVARYGRLPAPR